MRMYIWYITEIQLTWDTNKESLTVLVKGPPTLNYDTNNNSNNNYNFITIHTISLKVDYRMFKKCKQGVSSREGVYSSSPAGSVCSTV